MQCLNCSTLSLSYLGVCYDTWSVSTNQAILGYWKTESLRFRTIKAINRNKLIFFVITPADFLFTSSNLKQLFFIVIVVDVSQKDGKLFYAPVENFVEKLLGLCQGVISSDSVMPNIHRFRRRFHLQI